MVVKVSHDVKRTEIEAMRTFNTHMTRKSEPCDRLKAKCISEHIVTRQNMWAQRAKSGMKFRH